MLAVGRLAGEEAVGEVAHAVGPTTGFFVCLRERAQAEAAAAGTDALTASGGTRPIASPPGVSAFPPSAEELRADIEAFLTGRFLGVVRYSLWQRMSRSIRRHRAWLVPAAASALALAGLCLYVLTRPGTLEVAVTPAGARVEVAGESFEAGPSPHKLSVPSGRYRVRAILEDHVERLVEIDVSRSETREVRLDLEPTGRRSRRRWPSSRITAMSISDSSWRSPRAAEPEMRSS